MRRALRLAERAYGTAPNPQVGCVLVKNGVVVGEGWTQPLGQAHAEAMALRAAGDAAAGATAYVTLEPCSHWGRTPPCADALIAAGVARVVAATPDDNPRVGGAGLAKLRQAGIAVEVGLAEVRARKVNEAFFHYHATGTPLVTLKAALSLDGKIATRLGDSKWITGPGARAYVHRLRARSGAVMAGIGTLLADDAQLTARLPGLDLARQPLRIIVDSRLRTPPTARAVQLALAAPERQPLLIATTSRADFAQENNLRLPGVEVKRFPETAEGRVDLTALRAYLAAREINSVFVEGGGELHAALLAQGLAHKVLFFLAPKIIGGRDARTPVEGEGAATIADGISLGRLTLRRFGQDIALEGRILTQPYIC